MSSVDVWCGGERGGGGGDQAAPRRSIVDASWFDANTDGRHELGQIYYQGQVVGEARDEDEDGTSERYIHYKNGKVTAVSTDRDQDKRLDETVFYVDRKEQAWERDTDVDGFAETVSCVDANGVVQEKRLAPCDL